MTSESSASLWERSDARHNQQILTPYIFKSSALFVSLATEWHGRLYVLVSEGM